MLFQFQDNFDYLTLEQFIQGVVHQEIFNAKIFTHIITNQHYAARANCLRSYNLISRDIISRWTYPLVPDNNLLLGGATSYSLRRPSIYKENNVNLSRSSTLEEDVVVGNDTDIGDNTFISHSVIGRNCKIGANVRLEGCYIWDNVVIEDNVKISDALVCSDCRIKKGAVIDKGCLLAYNIVVGEGVHLAPYTKLTNKPVSPAAQQPPRVVAVNLGKDGKGNKWCEVERELLLKSYTPRDPAANLTQSLRYVHGYWLTQEDCYSVKFFFVKSRCRKSPWWRSLATWEQLINSGLALPTFEIEWTFQFNALTQVVHSNNDWQAINLWFEFCRFTDLVLSDDVTKLSITTKRVTQLDEENDVQDHEETDESSISEEELEEDEEYNPSDEDDDFNFKQESGETGSGEEVSGEESGDESQRKAALKRTQNKKMKVFFSI